MLKMARQKIEAPSVYWLTSEQYVALAGLAWFG